MIGIIGAGLSRLTSALYLGKPNVIFEKENEPGGHSRRFKQNGFLYAFGGHFLHLRNEWIRDLVTNEPGITLNSLSRHSAIYLNGVYSVFPFKITCRILQSEIRTLFTISIGKKLSKLSRSTCLQKM